MPRMFFTAASRNQHARAQRSLVEHLHPIYRKPNGAAWDATYEVALRGWDEDEKLWRERQSMITAAL